MFCWKIVVGIVGGRPDPQWVGESAAGRAAHETISNLKAANSCWIPGTAAFLQITNWPSTTSTFNIAEKM